MFEKLKVFYFKNKSGLIFTTKMILYYVGLLSIYEWIIVPYSETDRFLIAQIISLGEWILELMGYQTIDQISTAPTLLGIQGSSGVIIGGPCDGLSLFILYATFILSFAGKWWSKLVFILIGISIIHALNVLRVIALALVVVYAPDQLDFHHSYTFTLFVYGVVFLLWMLRIKFFNYFKW